MGGVVMVSGGARGLGRAITAALVSGGWQVSVGVRDPQLARQQLGKIAESVHLANFDATDRLAADRWTDEVVSEFGRLDVLVNNAGILRMVNFEQGTEEDLDLLWEVNFKAPFRLCRATLPHLRKTGRGRVISIASTDGKRYRDATTSLGYVVTKHALVQLNHAVRFAGWEDGVRATAICPGAIDTDMIANIPGVTPKAERLKPETVAEVVTFLLSLPNEASVAEFVTNTRLESSL
ncbi:MAG: SDR family NAD(P)-dependent oxidoreductase [Hyphomicrobiales bacterium]|nr:SDR family NAD(P)-dependent oxidoreductase [Hyphomicrobiales bacterium]